MKRKTSLWGGGGTIADIIGFGARRLSFTRIAAKTLIMLWLNFAMRWEAHTRPKQWAAATAAVSSNSEQQRNILEAGNNSAISHWLVKSCIALSPLPRPDGSLLDYDDDEMVTAWGWESNIQYIQSTERLAPIAEHPLKWQGKSAHNNPHPPLPPEAIVQCSSSLRSCIFLEWVPLSPRP